MIKLLSIISKYSNYLLITFLSGISFVQIISVDFFFSINQSVAILEYIAVGNILSRLSINNLCFEDKINDFVRIDLFNLLFLSALASIAYLFDPICMFLFMFFLFRDILKLSSVIREKISYLFLSLALLAIAYIFYSNQVYFVLFFILPILMSLAIFNISFKVNFSFHELLCLDIIKQKFRTIYSDTAVHVNSYLITVYPATVFSAADFVLFRKLLAVSSISSLLNSFSLFYFKKSSLRKINSYLLITALFVFIGNLIFFNEIYTTFALFFLIISFSTIFYSFCRAQFPRNAFLKISLISPIIISSFFLVNILILQSDIKLVNFFNILILSDLLVIYLINKKLLVKINESNNKAPIKWVFFAGPPKSGTSFLYDLFKKNGFSNSVGEIKEPDYWYNRMFPRNTLFNNIHLPNKVKDIETYYENYKSEELLIDCSPSTALNYEIISEIYKVNPDSYFIFIDRDQNDRALSQYRQFNDSGFDNESFEDAKNLISNRLKNNWHLSYNYAYDLRSTIKELITEYGDDKFLVIKFNDLINNPEYAFRKICGFIKEDMPTNLDLNNLSRNKRKLPRNKLVKYLIYLSFRLRLYDKIIAFLAMTNTLKYLRNIFFK